MTGSLASRNTGERVASNTNRITANAATESTPLIAVAAPSSRTDDEDEPIIITTRRQLRGATHSLQQRFLGKYLDNDKYISAWMNFDLMQLRPLTCYSYNLSLDLQEMGLL